MLHTPPLNLSEKRSKNGASAFNCLSTITCWITQRLTCFLDYDDLRRSKRSEKFNHTDQKTYTNKRILVFAE